VAASDRRSHSVPSRATGITGSLLARDLSIPDGRNGFTAAGTNGIQGQGLLLDTGK